MAGTIPLSLTQQFDEFGKPLSGGLLYIIQAGTVNTPQNPYQDAALSILMPNPILLDAAGRVPQFFLADGYIKIRLSDKKGVTQLARDGVLVIGPSAGGGGGGGVDPTTIIQTGMVSLFYGTGVVAGYVRPNSRTIGSASSGATERANADCQALFLWLWQQDPNLVVSSGRGASALADWNANKTIATPDARGCTFSALDDLGFTPAGRLTAPFFGANPILLGARGGLESNTLTNVQCQVGPHQHAVYLRDLGHAHGLSGGTLGGTGSNGIQGGGTFAGATSPVGITVNAASANITIGSVNGVANDNLTTNPTSAPAAAPHANVQPTMVLSPYLKL
jgi:hypothetical protein